MPVRALHFIKYLLLRPILTYIRIGMSWQFSLGCIFICFLQQASSQCFIQLYQVNAFNIFPIFFCCFIMQLLVYLVISEYCCIFQHLTFEFFVLCSSLCLNFTTCTTIVRRQNINCYYNMLLMNEFVGQPGKFCRLLTTLFESKVNLSQQNHTNISLSYLIQGQFAATK